MVLRIVFSLTGIRSVTEFVKSAGEIVPEAEIKVYVPDRCASSLHAALSAKAQINALMPRLKFDVSQDSKIMESADLIIISGLVAPRKTKEQYIPMVEATVKKLFQNLTLKKESKIIINGAVRGLICAYFVDELNIIQKQNIYILEPYFIAGERLLGTNPGSGFVYPTMGMLNGFDIHDGANTTPDNKTKFENLQTFHLGLEAMEAQTISNAIQALESDSVDSLSLLGKFPSPQEETFFDIGNEFPVFLPGPELDEQFRKEIKLAVKSLWLALQKFVLDYVTSKPEEA